MVAAPRTEALQCDRDLPQALVPHQVPEAVVQEFEVVDVDQQQREASPTRSGAAARLAKVMIETPAVGEARQRILVGQGAQREVRHPEIVRKARILLDRAPDHIQFEEARPLQFDRRIVRSADRLQSTDCDRDGNKHVALKGPEQQDAESDEEGQSCETALFHP